MGTNTYTENVLFKSVNVPGPDPAPVIVPGGVPGQIAFFGTSSEISSDPALTWDNTAKRVNVGMGASWALYNTSDQVTNFERMQFDFANTAFQVWSNVGGTGQARSLRVGTASGTGGSSPSRYMAINLAGTAAICQFQFPTAVAGSAMEMAGNNLTGVNVSQINFNVNPTITQSGTAGYTAVDINPTEASTGTGTNLLMRCAVGGTQRLTLTNGGLLKVGTGTAVATIDSGGSIAFNIQTFTTSQTLGAATTTARGDASAGAITFTLPAAASCPRRMYVVKKVDASANNVTIAANGAELIDGASTKPISTQNSSIILQSNNTGWDILSSL